MADLREVFEMVKQQTEPDIDSWAEQERRIRGTARKQKIGAFALVAAMAVAAVVFLAQDPTDDGADVVPAGDPQSPAPVVERGFALYDLGTGDLTYTGIVGSSSAVDVSPDGTKIAYVSSSIESGDTVHIATVDGSNERGFPRTGAVGVAKAPRWSPDGTKLVYQGKTSGEDIGNLYVLDVSTGRVERITDLDPMEAGIWWMAPTFSPDGRTVYFNKPRLADIGTTDVGQHWDVWSVPVSGGEPTLILRDAFAVDVSATGALTYSEASSSDVGFATGDLYVAASDGTGAEKVADGPTEIPRWSPDGSRIVYTANGPVRILNVETGDIEGQVGAFGWAEWVDDDNLMIEVGVA